MNETIQFLIRNGYAVLFSWVLFEQLGLPVPAAPLLLAAGALAGGLQAWTQRAFPVESLILRPLPATLPSG
jgi:membrane protein DedA with SNARE-associated domain